MSSHKPVKGLSKQSAGGSTTSRSKAPTPTSVSTIRTGKATRKIEPSPLSVSQTAPKSSLTRTESKSTPVTRTSKANNHHNLSWKSKQTGVVKETARTSTTSSARGEPGSHDVLQTAAQLYSWYYMISSLEKCRLNTQQNVSKLLRKRTAQLEAEEAEIADSRTRYEAEQILDFYDEISEERIASRLPVLVDGFIKHEETYNKTMKDALNVVHLKPSEFDQCNVLLQNLHTLQQEGRNLEIVIKELSTSCKKGHSKLFPVLQSMRSIIGSRHDNLSSAISVVTSCKNTLRLSLELESLTLG